MYPSSLRLKKLFCGWEYIYDQKLGPSEINEQCKINCLHILGYQWMSNKMLDVGAPVKM